MKMIHARAVVLLALAMAFVGSDRSAFAQETKAQLTTLNNLSFLACGNGCITGLLLNSWNGNFLNSVGTLLDAQTWAAQQTFTLPPIVSGLAGIGTRCATFSPSGQLGAASACLTGPNSTVIGHLSAWADATGTALGDVGMTLPSGLTIPLPIISGGTIDNAPIGGTTRAAGSFTALSGTANASINKSVSPLNFSAAILALQEADGIQAGFVAQSSQNSSAIYLFRTDGTWASKTAVQSGEPLGAYNFGGYDGTGTRLSQANITASAAQNWSNTSRGTYITFSTTGLGSTPSTTAMRIQPSSGVSIGATAVATDPGAGNVLVDGGIKSASVTLTSLSASATAPVYASGFCTTTPSAVTANGTAAFSFTNGAAGCSTTVGALTMPTAAHGWVCDAHDVTTPATYYVEQSASTATTATFVNYTRTTGVAANWNASDVLTFKCTGY